MSSPTVVSDASVPVNYLRIDGMYLLGRHSSDFIAADHVVEEIPGAYPKQPDRFAAAEADGTFRQSSITDPAELGLFGELHAPRDPGIRKCLAIAHAVVQGHVFAIDDRKAKGRAKDIDGNLQIPAAEDLVAAMIRENILEVPQADGIKEKRAQCHKFTLRVGSFGDIVQPSALRPDIPAQAPLANRPGFHRG